MTDPKRRTLGAILYPDFELLDLYGPLEMFGSLARDVDREYLPFVNEWRSMITTVAKSERGLEETVQGLSITPRWPVHAGAAELRLFTGSEP